MALNDPSPSISSAARPFRPASGSASQPFPPRANLDDADHGVSSTISAPGTVR